MPKLKLTQKSTTFRTAWVNITEKELTELRDENNEDADPLEWAYQQNPIWKFSDTDEPIIVFVDDEDGEPLYES